MTRGERQKKEELESLALAEEEISARLAEETAKLKRVQSENTEKSSHLKSVRQQLARLVRDQNSEIKHTEAATLGMEGRGGGKVGRLGEEEREARIYLEGYPVYLDENTILREGVNKLRQELSEREAERDEDIKRIRREVFEMKMKVELEFRRTKKNLEEEYNIAAHAKMREESERAVYECRNLSGKLNDDRDRVMSRMGAQKSLEVALAGARIGHGITESGSKMQEEEMELLERLVKEQEVVVSRGQGEISRLHGEVKELQRRARDAEGWGRKVEVGRGEERRAWGEMEGWRERVRAKVGEVEEWIRGGCALEEGGEMDMEGGSSMGGEAVVVEEEEEEEEE
ncbi:hypothetical protein TrRE_jg11073, partial [Triparma retinervis]